MRIIVSDSSCLIDLRKAELIEVLFTLPYTFVIPEPLFEYELLSLSQAEKRNLKNLGLNVWDLDGEGVALATRYFNENKAVGLNDCFALSIAVQNEDSIFLTGDQSLKKLAISERVEAHGVIWVTDQLLEHSCCHPDTLIAKIKILIDDPLVRIPTDLMLDAIKRYQL